MWIAHLTAVWRAADMSVSTRALSSGTIADGKTVSIMNQPLRVRGLLRLLARLRHRHTSYRLSFRKEVFKSWEVEVPTTIVMVIAARGISDYVDSALTGVCNGGFSCTPVRMLQNKASTLCALPPSASDRPS